MARIPYEWLKQTTLLSIVDNLIAHGLQPPSAPLSLAVACVLAQERYARIPYEWLLGGELENTILFILYDSHHSILQMCRRLCRPAHAEQEGECLTCLKCMCVCMYMHWWSGTYGMRLAS